MQERACHQFLHFKAYKAKNVVIHQIRLRQRDDAAANAKQAADVEVLAGLRLDRFIGGNHEQHQIDSTHAGQHVLDEPLMPGDIDESQAQRRSQFEVRKPKIDRDAAPLFFLETVGINPRERLHQGGLAVIDVSRRSHDDVLHWLVTV